MSGGLTIDGFIAPTVQELVADINTQVLAEIDPGLDLAPDQPIGQIIGIFAEKLAEVWELMTTVYNSMNPGAAEGNLLDNISSITGTHRRSATYSKVIANVNLNPSTTLAANSVASVAGFPKNRWVLTASVTNTGGSPANITSTWRSEQPGPFAANAVTLTVIETPSVGWNSISNPADAVPGIPEDTDAVLRVERENELAASGAGTVDSIRARVLEVPGVIQCFVFENTSLVTDGNGVPAKSFRVLVWDGVSPAAANADIAQAIWNIKPSGILSYGSLSGTAVDSQGNNQTVNFDRATQVPVYFDLTTTPGTLTAGQTAAVKAGLLAFGEKTLNLGVDVIDLAFRAQPLAVTGISDVPTFKLGTAPSPSGTSNIVIGDTQIATLDTTHMLVNGV